MSDRQMSLLDSAVSNGGEEVITSDKTVTRCYDAPSVSYVTQGDARHLPIPSSSVDLIVTSPPYFGLRDYGRPEEIGGEATLKEYLGAMRDALDEMSRVLKPTGSAFIVIGDKYARRGGVDRKVRGGVGDPGGRAHQRRPQYGIEGVRDKSLAGIPYRVALDAIDRGWLWRQDIVWSKPNPLPESVKDRARRSHETILHLATAPRYHSEPEASTFLDVWSHAVAGYRDPLGRKHPAVFPLPLVRQIVRGYCPPGGVVLDPFAGSGTTIVGAVEEGRIGVGVELSPDYVQIAHDRVEAIA